MKDEGEEERGKGAKVQRGKGAEVQRGRGAKGQRFKSFPASTHPRIYA